MRHNFFFVVLFILMLQGCSVGPDYGMTQYIPDEKIKQELSLQDGGKISSRWYETWNDEQLNQMVEFGMKNNTDVAVSMAKLKQARAQLWINEVEYLPQVSTQAGFNYDKYSKKIGAVENTHYYSAGFDAGWEIDLWGVGRRQTETDEALLKASEYSLKNVQTTVMAEIVLQYVYLMQNKENLRLAQENLRLQQEILDSVRRKYENGLTDDIDYQQALYLLESTKGKIPLLQSNIEQYKNALSILLGILPSQLPLEDNFTSPLFSQSYRFTTEDLYQLPASVIRNRPDVAMAEQELIGQNAQVGKAVAELYPSVNISAFWGYAAQGGRHLFGSKSQTFNYNPLIQLPLLDWNRLQNNVKLQKYIREEYLQTYKKSVLNAIAELKNALVSYQKSLQQNQSEKQAMIFSRQIVNRMQEKYNNGLTDFSELLNAQQNYIQAQNTYISGKTAIYRNMIAYYKAASGSYL